MRAMRLIPFEELGGVRFGLSPDAVLATLGPPIRQRPNRMTGVLEFKYPDVFVRFSGQPGTGVDEISAGPSEVLIENDTVPVHAFADYVRRADPAAYEDVGFLNSDRYGVMVDLDPEADEAVWITAISSTSWVQFRAEVSARRKERGR